MQDGVEVSGNQVEGEEIADVAVFSALPLSTPNDDEQQYEITPRRSEVVTEATAMDVLNEPNLRPETQQTAPNEEGRNQVLEYQPSAKRGSYEHN